MNGSGVISVTLTDLSTITPTGGQWQFTICPNASSACYQVITNAVVGATPNLSTQLSTGIRTPRFAAGPTSFGYLDAEISPTPQAGGTYFNVTSAVLRIWNGSAWAASGGGGGTTCGTPTCTVSSAGGGNGVLALSGNTSGTATLSAPAVAGTSTNPITVSNVLQVPNGVAATPAYSFTNGTSSGLAFSTNNSGDVVIFAGTFDAMGFNAANGPTIRSDIPLMWASTNNVFNAVTIDTAISRDAAGVVAVGVSNTAGNEAGLLRDANACRVTADITLTVNTPITICTWSLPAVAKAWAWQCQIPWVLSAGTGTNTLAIVANPSQTPTGATNGSAEIKTTNANVATEATTAISASGGTTLLTSPTLTPVATVFMSSTSGTLLASATAGTFAIQMTAAGTTATAAAKAGATCTLY
jgi:hypothetical protein